MEALQRLQAIDFVLVIVWSLLVGWGVKSGLVRQGIFAVTVYLGAIGASQAYKVGGQLLAMITGADTLPQAQLAAYIVLFVAVPALLMFVTWRIYPHTLLREKGRLDPIGGGIIGGVAGLMVVIGIVTMLRLFTATYWPDRDSMKITVSGELGRSQMVPVLNVAFAPVWNAMRVWFPEQLI